jgi:hypothetical protein
LATENIIYELLQGERVAKDENLRKSFAETTKRRYLSSVRIVLSVGWEEGG